MTRAMITLALLSGCQPTGWSGWIPRPDLEASSSGGCEDTDTDGSSGEPEPNDETTGQTSSAT